MIIDPEKLAGIELSRGGHETRAQGTCLLEAASFLAGEAHSYQPSCVSRYVINVGIVLNDNSPADRRQKLIQFLPAMLGTKDDGFDEARVRLWNDYLVSEEGAQMLPHNPWICTDEEFEELLQFFAEVIKPTTR